MHQTLPSPAGTKTLSQWGARAPKAELSCCKLGYSPTQLWGRAPPPHPPSPCCDFRGERRGRQPAPAVGVPMGEEQWDGAAGVILCPTCREQEGC